MALFKIVTKKDSRKTAAGQASGLATGTAAGPGTSSLGPVLGPVPAFSDVGLAQGQQSQPSESLKKKEPPIDPRIPQLISQLNTESRELRTMEERYILLRRKTQVTEQNMLSHYKKVSGDIKTALSKIQDLKNELREINEKMSLIDKEIEQCAKKADLALLQKYVNYWNPAEFVTRNEAIRIIDERLKNLKQ